VLGGPDFARRIPNAVPQQFPNILPRPRPAALVIVDRSIATEANIAWLRQNKYCCLVVGRERAGQFDPDQAIDTQDPHGARHRCVAGRGAEIRRSQPD